MDYTTLMKMELLRMKHARALCSMRIAREGISHAASTDSFTAAWQMLRESVASAEQAEADLEKLIAESQPVTKS